MPLSNRPPGILLLELGVGRCYCCVQSRIDGLDEEVVAMAQRRKDEKTWKVSFKKDTQPIGNLLARLGSTAPAWVVQHLPG